MTNVRCVNFYDLCRICTANSGEQKINIFSVEGKRRSLCSKLSECLSLIVDEKDRLPKVVCIQCLQSVETIINFRNVCKNSQTMLTNCVNTATLQNGGKVFIKDAIEGGGKSLSVVGCSGTNTLNVSNLSNIMTLQPTNASTTTLHGNDFINTIMQAVGIQPTDSNIQEKPIYTLTLDNKGIKTENIITPQLQQTAQLVEEKDPKQNALEEFLKMKPNIKVTPIVKKNAQKVQQQQHQLEQSSQQVHINQQDDHLQVQQQQPQQQITQMQIQQLQQQLNQQIQQQQQWQQQQFQQQLQQLTSQFQPQQITITAPTTSSDVISPSKSKKPKLNFVLTSPTNQTLTTSLPHLTAAAVTSQQPQIQLQLQTTPAQQQQQTTATLLSNLAPLFQQQAQQVLQNNSQQTTTNLLSPNKCFLPITIKDENSDQQIVAHIDAKNFVLPTTYQLHMKLQPQIATVDGQPIVQLTPTSIPATLQLAPQTLTNQTFQTNAAPTVDSINSIQQLLPQQTLQQHQQHIQPQSQNIPQNAHITSKQIIKGINNNNSNNFGTIDVATSTNDQNENQQIISHFNTNKQQKYKITQQIGGNTIEITPKTNFTQQIMQQVQQQQQQKQQQISNNSITTTTVPTQHGGITVQRITTKVSPTKNQSTVPSQPKLPMLNKQNLTISRINPQQQQSQSQQNKQQPQLQQNKVQTQNLKQNTINSNETQSQHMQSLSKAPIQNNQQVKQIQSAAIQPQQQQQQQQQDPNIQPTKVSVAKKTTRKTTKATTIQQNKEDQRQTQTVNNSNSEDSGIKSQNLGVTTNAETIANATTLATSTSFISNVSDANPIETVQTAVGLECGQCGRAFKKKEHLTQHVKLHAGLRPFKCTEEGCSKAFSRKEHLLRHLVSHSGKKMFSCEVCQKPFSRKDNLNKHRRIHNGQAISSNYTCEICNKTFAVKGYFLQHKLMHEQPPIAAGTATKKVDKKSSQTVNATSAVKVHEIQQSRPQEQQLQQQQQQQQQQQKQQRQQLQHQEQQIQILHQQISHQQVQSQQQQQQPHQQQQQIMHFQLPTIVNSQDLANSTITITQSNPNLKTIGNHDATVLNLPSSLGNFVQLSSAQFVNATTGHIIKIEK